MFSLKSMVGAEGACLFGRSYRQDFCFFFYFFDFLELMEEVLVCWRWPEVWGWMWEVMVVVWTLVRVLI